MDTVVKPGWQTTEFWMPLISLVVGGLVAYGYIPAKDAPTFMGYVAAMIVGSITLGGNIVLFLHYMRSRTTQKAALLQMASEKDSGPTIGIGDVPQGAVPKSPAPSKV